MAAPRGSKRSHFPTPPISPDQPQTPQPLPRPTEMSRFRSWQSARSSSLDMMNTPATPQTPLRAVSDPIPVVTQPIGTISDRFTSFDRSSSPEPEVEAEKPNPYTISYYNILGLPESPDVTTKDIEKAYSNLLSNPPEDLPHNQATLQRIHKTLTNSIRRRTYDLGRRTHLLHQSQLKDRENRERNKSISYIDEYIRTRDARSTKAKEFNDNLEIKIKKMEVESLKRQLDEKIKEKVRVVGIGGSMRRKMGLNGMDEEEGVSYEEMYFGAKELLLTGERLSLDFEFTGSGSEEDFDEENEFGGTFSDRKEEKEDSVMNEEPENVKVPAVAILASEIVSSTLETIPTSAERTLDIEDQCEEIVDMPEMTSKPNEVVPMYTETTIEKILDILFSGPTPVPKTETRSYKEIWEFDYNSDSDTDTDIEVDSNTDTDTESDTDSNDEKKEICEADFCSPSNYTSYSTSHCTEIDPAVCTTEPEPASTSPTPAHEDSGDTEIWENDYNHEADTSEAKLLFVSVSVSMLVVSAGFACFGNLAV